MEAFLTGFLTVLAALVLIALVLAAVAVGILYFVDIKQTRHAIRRNYPVIGRMRYVFEHLGEFFRQYFFAMDREEMPFNRAQRSWVYRAAKNLDNTVPFGSSRDLRNPGTIIFVNCPFPTLDEEAVPAEPIVFGPYARDPYETSSIFNISAMSYGSLSKAAIEALNGGAKIGGFYHNTGEGCVSPYHKLGADIMWQIGTGYFGARDAESDGAGHVGA